MGSPRFTLASLALAVVFFGFSFGFSWVLHGFVTALAAQMLVNVGAGSPGRMLENDRVYTVYKLYKVTSLHARVY